MLDKIYKESMVELPMVALRGIWIYPHMVMHFDVGREKSKASIRKAMMTDSKIILAGQKDPNVEWPDEDDIYEMGIVANIKQTIRLGNGNIRVLVEGESRAKIIEYLDKENEFTVKAIEYSYNEDMKLSPEMEAIARLVIKDMEVYLEAKEEIPKEVAFNLKEIENPSRLADVIVSYLQLDLKTYQDVLDELDVYERLILIHEIISKEIELLKIEEDINRKVRDTINKSQKDYYLKEQLQIIKSELGEGADQDDYIEEYREKIAAIDLDEDSKDHLLKELNRLEFIAPGSPEINVVRSYLDYVLELPWGVYTEDKIDIKKSRQVLDQDHYGLKDVKERVLEFISVRKLKKDMKGSILCLVGPPGVGKTSIARSVAESMNRNYVSMRLGGLTDESEIRGHRRTYIGSMPGRIVTSMTNAKSMNPVFLLDEIDKLSSDYRADPSSAMLEVLDPNQNDEFMDRYIEIPLDLSQVMFVTTANSTSTIPQALLDRMEVISISGYTSEEKFNIAKKHLVPKQIEEHGLDKSQISISDGVIRKIINNYTREAGVRNLERYVAKVCRKAAMKIVEEDCNKVGVSLRNYVDFLGPELIMDDDYIKEPEIGVVTGLAWTSVGGEILQIEVNKMPGTGKIQLTGSLGDVMKESAMAALSFIRSNTDEYGLSQDFHEKIDLHVHVPEGATPKDGPSAGITMTTAMVSSLTKKKVRKDIAMTGEVTIRGRVLPIGGLKEKVLAANRYGIKEIIIPYANKRDLDEIPESVRKETTFHPVKEVSEVLKLALLEE